MPAKLAHSKQTYHLIDLFPNSSLCIINGLSGSDEADLALDVSARRLRNVDLATSL
jgi:hypothetical protein